MEGDQNLQGPSLSADAAGQLEGDYVQEDRKTTVSPVELEENHEVEVGRERTREPRLHLESRVLELKQH